MTVTRFLRKTGLVRRQTHLAVAIFPDEASAFQAYRLLHYYGISPEHLAIVGKGYSNPDHIGLLRPMQIALRQARSWSLWAGTIASLLAFVLILAQSHGYSNLDSLKPLWLMPAAGVMGGFLGAVIGGLFGLFGEGTTISVYRHHLNRGHYLLMMEGLRKTSALWTGNIRTIFYAEIVLSAASQTSEQEPGDRVMMRRCLELAQGGPGPNGT